MPYQVRYDDFFVQRDLDEEKRLLDKLNPKGEPFIFIHEDAARGFTLNRDHFVDKTLKTIENSLTIVYLVVIHDCQNLKHHTSH